MEKTDYSQLNGRLLRIFLSVYETGSINKAAIELGLNQSTVSYSIDRLRDLFEDPLFVKNGRGISPSDRARILAPRIRELTIDMGTLLAAPEYLPENDHEKIKIATYVSGLLPICKRLFTEFHTQSPNASIQFLEVGPRNNVEHFIDHQLAEVVLSVRPSSIPYFIHSQTVWPLSWRCLYDPTQRGPVSSEEEYFSATHAALDQGGSDRGVLGHILEALSRSIDIKVTAPDVISLQQMIIGTDLIATLPVSFVAGNHSKLAHCDIPIQVPGVHLEMFWHRRVEHSPRNKWIRDVTMKTFLEFE